MPFVPRGVAPQQSPQTSGGLLPAAAALTRIGGGYLSNAGSWPGALIGGGSELLAQLLEGSFNFGKEDFARIGAEGAIGAVPLGRLISSGSTAARTLGSVAKGGTFGAAAEYGRQAAEQGTLTPDLDPGRMAFGTLAGGAASGIGGLLNVPKIEPPLPRVRPDYSGEVVSNSGEVLRPRPVVAQPTSPGGPVYNIGAHRAQPDPSQPLDMFNRPRGISQGRMPIGSTPADPTGPPIGGGDMAALSDVGEGATRSRPRVRGPQTADEFVTSREYDAALQEDRVRELRRQLGLGGGLPDQLTVTEQSLAREARNASAQEELSAIRRTLGMEMQEPDAVRRTISAETPTGRESTTIKFEVPGAEDVTDVATRSASGGRRLRPEGAGVELDPEVEGIIQRAMQHPPGSPTRLFGEWLAAGKTLDEAEALAQKGVSPVSQQRVQQILAENPNPDLDVLMAAGRRGPLGSVDADVASAQGSRGPLGSTPDPDILAAVARRGPLGSVDADVAAASARQGPLGSIPKPKFPLVPGSDPEQEGLQSLLDFLQIDEAYGAAKEAGKLAPEMGGIFGRTAARAKELNEVPPVSRAPKLGGETGAGITELLLHAAGGALGAGVGAALDPEGSPIEGALTGLAIGAGAPAIPRLLQSVNMSPTQLTEPGAAREAARRIVKELPFYQRASFLLDARGIVPNVVLGPWGSMMTSSIEAALKGDPRGWAAVRSGWNLLDFVKRDIPGAFDEAKQLITRGELGRAEGLAENLGLNFKTGLSAPGFGMTAGDVAARRHLMNAGFSDLEARAMTLTAEPAKGTLAHSVVNFGRDNVLGNIMLPFRRTPANIMSSGSDRLPVVGVIKKFLGTGDLNRRDLAVEQLGGFGTATAGYQLGQELDDPRSFGQNVASRSASNLAGRYSLPTMLGILAGRTVGQGKDLNIRNITQGVEQAIPLPTAGQLVDIPYYLASKAGLTANDDPRLPRGIVPFQHLMPDNPRPLPLSNLRLRR